MADPYADIFAPGRPRLDPYADIFERPAPVLRKRTLAEEAQAVFPKPPSLLKRIITDIQHPITYETPEETELRLWETRAAAIREAQQPGFIANVKAGRVTPAMGQILRVIGEGTMLGGPTLLARAAGGEAISAATGVAGRWALTPLAARLAAQRAARYAPQREAWTTAERAAQQVARRVAGPKDPYAGDFKLPTPVERQIALETTGSDPIEKRFLFHVAGEEYRAGGLRPSPDKVYLSATGPVVRPGGTVFAVDQTMLEPSKLKATGGPGAFYTYDGVIPESAMLNLGKRSHERFPTYLRIGEALSREAAARPQPPAQAPLIETQPVAPRLALAGQEAQAPPIVSAVQELLVAPPPGAGKFRPMSDLGRLPVKGSTILGNVPSADPLHPAYDVAVRRNAASSWTLSARSAYAEQPLGEFTSLKALTQRTEKILTGSKTLSQLRAEARARSASAWGGAQKRLEREFSEGYAAYLQTAEENLAEVAPAIAARAQAGAMRLPPAPAPIGLTQQVEEIFRLGNPGFRLRTSQAVQRSIEKTRTFFAAPGAELQGAKTPTPWQEVRNDFRLFKDVPRQDVPRAVKKDVVGVVQPLNPDEYSIFNRYVVLRDLREEFQMAAQQGRKPSIPLGVPESEIDAAYTAVGRQVTPKIQAALNRHDKLQRATTDDLIARGKLSLDEAHQFHFRHYVLDYDDLRGVRAPRAPAPGLQAAQPRAIMARRGSERAIQTDYVNVMQRKLSIYHLENAADDFTAQLQPKVDWTGRLTEAQRLAAFGQAGRPSHASQIADVPGVGRLVTWQPRPGNQLFPGYSVATRIVDEATTRTLTTGELAQMAQMAAEAAPGVVGARQALMLGRPKPMWLVDPKVARYLDTYNLGQKNGDLLRQANAFMSIWKRAIVDSLGLPFQFRNLFGGDLESGYMIARLPVKTPVGRATSLLVREAYGGQLSPAEQAFLDLARQHRVLHSGFVGTIRTSLRDQPELLHLQEPLVALAKAPLRAIGQYEKVFRVREDILRVASFLDNVERIQRGEMIRTSKAIDIRGLAPISAAGKVAREAFVDYGNRSMAEEAFGQTIAPFVTWFYQTTRNWANLAARDPKQIILKSLPIYAAMFTWNNTGERAKVEADLPPWMQLMPHIITGWELPDGRPLVMGFGQTAAGAAASFVGLNKAAALAGQVARGELTSEEALAKLPGGMLTEAARTMAFTATGPLITVPAETALAVASRGQMLVDVRRGAPRVPERLAGTGAGIWQFAGQEARALVPPVDILLRQFEPHKAMPPGVPITTRAAMAVGALKAPDIAAEARRRQVEASQRAEKGREERLYRVEQIFIRTGDVGAVMKEAARQRLTADEIARRLQSTRVQIDRTRQQLLRERDPQRYAGLRRMLEQLYAQAAFERLKQTPLSVRGEAVLRP